MIREPWDQRLDETSAHYRLFVWWRDQAPRPPPSDPALASTYDWSSRAAAWDAHQSVPRGIEAQLDEGLRALGETFILEARRLLSRARVGGGELDAKEIAALGKTLVQIKILVLESRQRLEGPDEIEAAERLVEGLTEEEQRVLLRLASRNA